MRTRSTPSIGKVRHLATMVLAVAAVIVGVLGGLGYSGSAAQAQYGSHRLSVQKAGSGVGTVTSTPSGIACGSSCTASFAAGTTVRLSASADQGSLFTGWSGDCSGSGDCLVNLAADRSVTANFVATHRLSVTKAGAGTGAVVSIPVGIACGSGCSASFVTGTMVRLTAAADSGSAFTRWEGACGGGAECVVTMDAERAVTAIFSELPHILDSSRPEPRQVVPVATANPSDTGAVAQLAAGVTGNGVIEAGERTPLALEANRIGCGFNEFRCYARLTPGVRVVLQARPLAGYVFRAWGGACAGQGERCVIVARALQTVNAIFVPRVAAGSVGLAVRPIDVRMKWSRSVGSGRLVVLGRVGGSARLRVQVRRPGGAPLLTRHMSVPAGRFERVLPFRRSVLSRGAVILPGGFVLSVVGSSGGSPLPFELRPIVVPAPLEGVVRHAYASAVEAGPATARLPSGATEAWAHFRLATQPTTRLPITIKWYDPKGTPLGTFMKANRPEIVSSIGSRSGVPRGSWVVELRAGSTIVKRVSVRVG